MTNEKNNTPTKYVRYPLASAGRRIAAKLFDIILLGIVIFCLGLAIFCTDPTFSWSGEWKITETWRYGIFGTVMAIIFFGCMLLLPRLWKKTIGMKMLGLAYVNNLPLSNFTFNIFKHEIMVWVVPVFVSFVMSWVLTAINAQQALALLEGVSKSFAPSAPQGDLAVFYYVGTGFATAYIISILLLLAIIIGVCVANKKPAFHDKFSNVFVIHLRPLNTPDKQMNKKQNKMKKINYGIPGEISSSELEEIDKL